MKEEKDALIGELEEYHMKNKTGVQASNKAAAIDMRAAMKNIGIEVNWGKLDVLFHGWLTSQYNKFENLAEHTGCQAFAFVMHGHINDTMIPTTLETDDVLSFFNEVLNITPEEVAQKYEV